MSDIDWVSVDEYAQITGLDQLSIDELIERDKLTFKEENGVIFIDASKNIGAIVPIEIENINTQDNAELPMHFAEKTIGTIMNLHERVLDAKDETIESIKVENSLLKDGLASLQELYDEDRGTIATLTEQLRISQQEVEFMRRKYKLMWGKVAEDYAAKPTQ